MRPNHKALLGLVACLMAFGQKQDGSIEGKLLDAQTGRPLPNVELLILISGVGKPLKTAADGSYSVTDLAAGAYFLTMSYTSGYSTNGRRLNLLGGQHLTGIDVKAVKAAVLAGRLLDPDKRPVAGASVQARVPAYLNGRLSSSVMSTKTNDLGEYRIAYLSPGAYYVMVEQPKLAIRKSTTTDGDAKEREPVLAAARTWYPNSPTWQGALAVNLVPGEQHEGLDITLIREPTVCVRSRLVETVSDGRAQILAQVVEDVPGGMSTTAEGRFTREESVEVCGIPPGAYRFRAVRREENGDERYASEAFVVSKRPVRVADLVLKPLPEMRGRLVIEGGGDPPTLPKPVSVSVHQTDLMTIVRPGAYARLTQPGPFVLPAVFPEELCLDVYPPPGVYVKSATVKGIDVLRATFHASDGELEIVLGADGPSISGVVVDKDNQPVPGALILLGADPLPSPLAPHDLLHQIPDQDGRFKFTGMPPGKYRLLAFADYELDSMRSPEFFRAHSFDGESLTLAAKEVRSVTCVAK